MREHNGLYQAIIVSNRDPKNQRRVTARVPDVLGQTVSDWARPASIMDSPLPPGDMVWIHFPNGDIRYPVYHVPNDPKHGRVVPTKDQLDVLGPDSMTQLNLGKTQAHLLGPGGGSGALLNGDLHAKGTGGYINVYALDFIETSDASQKTGIEQIPFDTIEAIRNAPAYQYTYKESGHTSIGPMRADLPEVSRMGDHHVSQGALIGILWDAVFRMARDSDVMRSEVEYLRGEIETLKKNGSANTLGEDL